ncbi:MAG: S-layer homology domain-containing protein [Bacillota bacterium]|nr:S-layer homology domain-containing protein [Bacillota bacterium]
MKKFTAFILTISVLIASLATCAGAAYEKDVNVAYIRIAKQLVESVDVSKISDDASFKVDTDEYNGYKLEDTDKDGVLDSFKSIDKISGIIKAYCPFELSGILCNFSTNFLRKGKISSAFYRIDISDGLHLKDADSKAKEVADDVKAKAKSQREMVTLVNQWLVDNVSYATDYNDFIAPYDCKEAYGALCEHKAVSIGYTLAFNMILKKLGIPVVNVTGHTADTDADHSWNEVYVDEQWLFVDVAFDDLKADGYSDEDKKAHQQDCLMLTKDQFYNSSKVVSETDNVVEKAKDIFYKNCVDDEANELKSKGLFSGDSTGFRLDDGLTRAEMAVMLARVNGGTQEIEKNSEYYACKCVFTDVPDWAKPYVGYCADKGLINGIGDNLYGSDNKANKLDFLTVILRANGVTDGYDYNTSDVKAVELGYLSLERAAFPELSRGDAANITYNILQIRIM